MVSEPILPLHGLLLVNWMRFSGQSTEHSELRSQPLPDKIMEQVKRTYFQKCTYLPCHGSGCVRRDRTVFSHLLPPTVLNFYDRSKCNQYRY